MNQKIFAFLGMTPRWVVPFAGLGFVVLGAAGVAAIVVLIPVWLPLLIGWGVFHWVRDQFDPNPAPSNRPIFTDAIETPPRPGGRHGGPKPAPPRVFPAADYGTNPPPAWRPGPNDGPPPAPPSMGRERIDR